MKKRIILIIMILFSIKVNSMQGPVVQPQICKYPDIKFFEIVEEEGSPKFSFRPFVDQVLVDFKGDEIKILDVKFDKAEALGALFTVYDLFLGKVFEKAAKGNVPVSSFLRSGYEDDERLLLAAIGKKAALQAFNSKAESKTIEINKDEELIIKKLSNAIREKIYGIDEKNGVIDYFIVVKERAKFFSWLGKKSYFLKSLDSDFLNTYLNYIYLFTLSFLIDNEHEASRFLTCMYAIYENTLLPKLGSAVKKAETSAFLPVFSIIEQESGMAEKIKPEPLSLDQSRGALNLLSSTLNSIATLKFI